jgi:hypothetical protein
VKPAPGALTTEQCHRIFRHTLDAFSKQTSARASGVARLLTVTTTTNGNLSFTWNANVKIPDVMPHANVIEKCIQHELGVVEQLETPEAWTCIVVEHLETTNTDGLVDMQCLAAPLLQTVIFNGMPKQVMEGPTWMWARDRSLPAAASIQLAVLDPQSKIHKRFLAYARSNGKVEVSYGGVMGKARLFHVKELFSQCTRCWLHSHINRATECKTRKNVCACCTMAHLTKDHNKACGKCASLMKAHCNCADWCVNCKGAHASNNIMCPNRLWYRTRPNANANLPRHQSDPASRIWAIYCPINQIDVRSTQLLQSDVRSAAVGEIDVRSVHTSEIDVRSALTSEIDVRSARTSVILMSGQCKVAKLMSGRL